MRQPCRFDGCDKTARGLGHCAGHYKQLRLGQQLRPLAQYQRNVGKTCEGPDCDRPAISRGLCSGHKAQQERGLELAPIGQRRPGPNRMYEGVECNFDGCGRQAVARAMCGAHRAQLKRGEQLRPLGTRTPPPNRVCSVVDCPGDVSRKGMCQTHYRQHLRTGQTQPARKSPGRYVDPDSGYAYVKRPGHPEARKGGGWAPEHRVVMADQLGRALFAEENVHHRNGVRDDNSVSNLELWTKSQPPGQRVVDKLAWAREILEQYADVSDRFNME